MCATSLACVVLSDSTPFHRTPSTAVLGYLCNALSGSPTPQTRSSRGARCGCTLTRPYEDFSDPASVPADSSTLRSSPTSPKDATGIAQHGSAGKAWQKCVGVPQGRHDLPGVYPNSKYLNRPSSRAIQCLRPQKGRGERRMKGGSFQFLLTLWLRKPVMEPVWRGCKRSPNQFLPTEAKNGVGALRDRVATCIKESDKRNVAKMCRFLCCGSCKARSILVHSESRNWRRPRR